MRTTFNPMGVTDIMYNWFPNYKAEKEYVWGTTFTTTDNGWLYIYAQVNNATVTILADGIEIWRCYNNNYADGQGCLVPVNKNQIITFSGNTYTQTRICKFYPCIGKNKLF